MGESFLKKLILKYESIKPGCIQMFFLSTFFNRIIATYRGSESISLSLAGVCEATSDY
jgi:hypothetical protein